VAQASGHQARPIRHGTARRAITQFPLPGLQSARHGDPRSASIRRGLSSSFPSAAPRASTTTPAFAPARPRRKRSPSQRPKRLGQHPIPHRQGSQGRQQPQDGRRLRFRRRWAAGRSMAEEPAAKGSYPPFAQTKKSPPTNAKPGPRGAPPVGSRPHFSHKSPGTREAISEAGSRGVAGLHLQRWASNHLSPVIRLISGTHQRQEKQCSLDLRLVIAAKVVSQLGLGWGWDQAQL